MVGLLVGGRRVLVRVHLDEHDVRRVVAVLDDVEAQHTRLAARGLGIGSGRVQKGLDHVGQHGNVHMDHSHGSILPLDRARHPPFPMILEKGLASGPRWCPFSKIIADGGRVGGWDLQRHAGLEQRLQPVQDEPPPP